jgi:hypothetical protein
MIKFQVGVAARTETGAGERVTREVQVRVKGEREGGQRSNEGCWGGNEIWNETLLALEGRECEISNGMGNETEC